MKIITSVENLLDGVRQLLLCAAVAGAIACIVTILTGCISVPPLPKDSTIKGVHLKVVTPWGTAEQVIDEVSTGVAARNSSLPDGVAPAGTRQISDLKPAAAGGVR